MMCPVRAAAQTERPTEEWEMPMLPAFVIVACSVENNTVIYLGGIVCLFVMSVNLV